MSNPGQYSVPVKCRDYADYKRALEVMELLNRQNSDYPLTCTLGSGPKEPEREGVRYLDLHCSSMAKIQHFMEMGDQLEKDIMNLNRSLKLDEMGKDPTRVTGNSILDEIFGPLNPAAEDEYLRQLKTLQDRIRKARGLD